MIIINIETITSVECLGPSTEYVYDVCVPETNTYFANDILVHNTDSIFLHIDPVLRAVLGSEYDVTSDDEKIEIVLQIIRRAADFLNNHAIKQMLEIHNTPSTESLANLYDFRFKEELVIKRSLFLDTKKKYALWTIQKEKERIDKLSFVGLEIVRSDYPRYTKDMMKDLLDKILKQNINKAKMLRLIDQYVEEYKALLLSGSLDAGIPCVWNSREYKTEPIAVRGMMVYNAIYGNVFSAGDKGYRYKLNSIAINSLNKKQQEALYELQRSGRAKEFNFIVVPDNTSLDTKLLVPDITGMLDYAVYDRLSPILDLFNIDVKNTYSVGW